MSVNSRLTFTTRSRVMFTTHSRVMFTTWRDSCGNAVDEYGGLVKYQKANLAGGWAPPSSGHVAGNSVPE